MGRRKDTRLFPSFHTSIYWLVTTASPSALVSSLSTVADAVVVDDDVGTPILNINDACNFALSAISKHFSASPNRCRNEIGNSYKVVVVTDDNDDDASIWSRVMNMGGSSMS